MKAETVLETARAQIGYREGANNNNIYGREYGLNFQPWCVIFLWWCFKHSLDGRTEKLSDFMPNSAHCNGVRSFALGIDRWYPRSEIGLHVNIEVGDLVVWDTNGDNSGDHIGIVESVVSNNSFTTIEGNHSDAVARVNRSFANVMGVYKPLYDFDFREAENAGGASPSPTGSKAEDAGGGNTSSTASGPPRSLEMCHRHVSSTRRIPQGEGNGENEGEETPHPSAALTPSPQGEGCEKAFLQIGSPGKEGCGTETLKFGSAGYKVRIIQAVLMLNGYNLGRCGIDGEFGEMTEKAVKAFQKSRGLVCSGIVDCKTLRAMWKGEN